MDKTVEFVFDVISPASYLAWKRLPALAAETGARIVWRPVLLGGVHKASGNSAPLTVPAKGHWLMHDLQRWARRHGVPFAMNPHFPFSTITAMRIATGLLQRRPQDFLRATDAMFDAIWRDGLNLADAGVLADTLARAGFDAPSLLALAAEPEVKAALVAAGDDAVARGVFGAPSFFVGAQLHFGQDRLDFVREDLLA